MILGDGTGKFTEKFEVAASNILKAADLNGDGNLDLIFSGTFTNNVGVLFGDGTGFFGNAAMLVPSLFLNPINGITVADFIGSGKMGIAYCNYSAGTVTVITDIMAMINGAAGPQGPQGPAGVAGSVGPQGLQGVAGTSDLPSGTLIHVAKGSPAPSPSDWTLIGTITETVTGTNKKPVKVSIQVYQKK